MKRPIWNSGYDLTSDLLNFREGGFEEEISTRMKNIMKSKGVCVKAEGDDVLLPISSSSSSIVYISSGVAVDSEGKLCKLISGYDLQCYSSDAGKYIQIEHLTVDSDSQPHPVTGALNDTKRDYDTNGDDIITKVVVEDPDKVTLGKIVSCTTGALVVIDKSRDTGHREYFSTFLVHKDPPDAPIGLILTTGFDEELISSTDVGEIIEDASKKSCFIKADWSSCSDDYGIDSYQVSFIPVTLSGSEETEYADREEVIEVRVGSPVNNFCYRQGLVAGTRYKIRVRSVDGSPSKNVSSWSTSGSILVGWGDPPVMPDLSIDEERYAVIVTWDENPDCVGYQFCWKINSAPGFDDPDSHKIILPRNSTRAFIPGNSGDTIYIIVRALDGAYQTSDIKSINGIIDRPPSIPLWPSEEV